MPVAFFPPTVLMLPREGHWGHRNSSQRPSSAEVVGSLSAGHIPRPQGKRELDPLPELHLPPRKAAGAGHEGGSALLAAKPAVSPQAESLLLGVESPHALSVRPDPPASEDPHGLQSHSCDRGALLEGTLPSTCVHGGPVLQACSALRPPSEGPPFLPQAPRTPVICGLCEVSCFLQILLLAGSRRAGHCPWEMSTGVSPVFPSLKGRRVGCCWAVLGG